MRKFFAVISVIAISLGLKIIFQKIWVTQDPVPFKSENISPVTPQRQILFGQKIDINSAPRHYLTILPGIGPKLAARIIAKRNEIGGFSSVEEIKQVRGIGPSKLSKIRHFIDAR